LFNFMNRNDPEDKLPEEPTIQNLDALPHLPKSAPRQPETPAASASLPVETSGSADNVFPTLEIPRETPAAPPQTETAATPDDKAIPTGGPLFPPLPQRPTRRSVFEYLFSFETRSGRIIRTLLRWLAAITGLFALGLLAGYLLLYQPTQVELDATQLKLKQANQAVIQKDQSLQSALSERTQVQQTLQQAQASIKKASSENQLLQVLVNIGNARVALVNKDGATAKAAMEQAQAGMLQAQPFLESIDKTKFDVLKTRLDLAAKELGGDPQAALADLEKLSLDLTDLHQKTFAK
jgi:hypothetical protein